MAAVISAAALGYHRESRRLTESQAEGISRITDALHLAAETATAFLSDAVRPPRWNESRDTVRFQTARLLLSFTAPPVRLTSSSWRCMLREGEATRVWLDSICAGRGFRVTSSGAVIVVSDTSPDHLWTLEQHTLFVDNKKGGLWVQRGTQPPVPVAPLVDRLTVYPDPVSSEGHGFSLGLSAAWQAGDETAIRRNMYRYMPAEERWEG